MKEFVRGISLKTSVSLPFFQKGFDPYTKHYAYEYHKAFQGPSQLNEKRLKGLKHFIRFSFSVCS